MTTVIGYHEVNDSTHWLASPKRKELFEPLGITHRTFPTRKTHRVAVLFEVPDMAAFQAAIQSADGATAMKYDGVRPETLVLLVGT